MRASKDSRLLSTILIVFPVALRSQWYPIRVSLTDRRKTPSAPRLQVLIHDNREADTIHAIPAQSYIQASLHILRLSDSGSPGSAMRLPLSLAITSPSEGPLLAFDHGSGELVLVELQGHLELSLDGVESKHPAADSASNGIKAGQKVGKLDLSVPVSLSILRNIPVLVAKHVLILLSPPYRPSITVSTDPSHWSPPLGRKAGDTECTHGYPQALSASQSTRSLLRCIRHAPTRNILAYQAHGLAPRQQRKAHPVQLFAF